MLRTIVTLMIGAAGGWAMARCANGNGQIGPPDTQKRLSIFVTSPAVGPVAEVVNLFKLKMCNLGWTEGEDIAYDLHQPPHPLRNIEDMSAHAAKLIARSPSADVIWLVNTGNALALWEVQKHQEPPARIQVIGSSVSEKRVVESGLVIDARKPGKNFTGVLNRSDELGPIRLELTKQLLSSNGKPLKVAVFYTPGSTDELVAIRNAPAADGVTIEPIEFDDYRDLDSPFERIPDGVQAVLTTHDQFFRNSAERIIERAAKRRLPLPLIGYRESFARLGAVMSYGTSLRRQIETSATLVTRILKGERAANVALEPATLPELWLNRTAANTLGLPNIDSLRNRPDANVIE